MITSFTPKLRRRERVISSNVRPLISTSALGRLSVRGRSRVPRPAAKIIAFIRASPYEKQPLTELLRLRRLPDSVAAARDDGLPLPRLLFRADVLPNARRGRRSDAGRPYNRKKPSSLGIHGLDTRQRWRQPVTLHWPGNRRRFADG